MECVATQPTTAAIAYGLYPKSSAELMVLPCDMGGSSFDISRPTIEDGMFEVEAAAGDSHLGSEDSGNLTDDFPI